MLNSYLSIRHLKLRRLYKSAALGFVIMLGISCESSLAETTSASPSEQPVGARETNAECSGRDQKLLTNLWLAYIEKSPDLLSVVASQRQSGLSCEALAGYLANPFSTRAAGQPSSVSVQPLLALTDPNFEPLYPVMSESEPSYLRVGRAKTLTINSVNIFAPVRSLDKTEQLAASAAQAIVNLLCQRLRPEAEFFASYLQNSREIQTLQSLRVVKKSSSNRRGKLTVSQFERLKNLQGKHEQLRVKLVSLVGEEAALKLDNELQFESAKRSSSSSYREEKL